MFDWIPRHQPFSGLLLFPQLVAPRDAIEGALRAQGVRLGRRTPGVGRRGWGYSLDHPEWGRAELGTEPVARPPGGGWLSFVGGLTDRERRLAQGARSWVRLRGWPGDVDVLRGRKHGLAYFLAALGEAGVAAVDELSGRVWSPGALRLELAHDGALDVLQLCTVHLSTRAQAGGRAWLHTHGLAAAGGVDFEVLDPGPLVRDRGGAFLRGVALALLEGAARPGQVDYVPTDDHRAVRLATLPEFEARASPFWARRVRDPSCPHHAGPARVVLCDPGDNRVLRPSRYLSEADCGARIRWSPDAQDLLEERGYATLPLLQGLRRELAALPVAVQVEVAVPGPCPDEWVYAWVRAEALDDDQVHGRVLQEPGDDAGEGALRGEVSLPLEAIVDWRLGTPLGEVGPRSLGSALALREALPTLRPRGPGEVH